MEVCFWGYSESYCEINHAEHMPHNILVMASQDNDLEVYIWDLSKHPFFLTDNEGNGDVGESPFAPQDVCAGHTPDQDLYVTGFTLWYSCLPSLRHPYPKWTVL